MTTPNMGLTPPSPSVTTGPLWASLLNACFDTIDAHDHSNSSGVKIPSAGININADLSMGSFNLNAIRALRLDNQSATLSTASDLRILYAKNGELAYRDSLGNEVVITNAGSIAGATGTISGLSSPASASYNSVTGTFSFLKDTAKPGKFVTGDILLYEYDNAAANPITIKSPASLASAYTLTLPSAVPSQAGVVVMGTGGGLGTGLPDGAAATPALAFASELSTGLYRDTTAVIGVSIAGTLTTKFNANGAMFVSGTTALTPAISFNTFNDAGIYSDANNTVSLACNGVRAAKFSDTYARFTNGSAAVPGISFLNATDAGFYRRASNEVGFSAAGTEVGFFGHGVLSLAAKTYVVDGSLSAPAYSFGTDAAMGMYRESAGILGITASSIVRINSVNISESLQFGTNGSFKVKIFTGTLAGLSAIDLTVSGSALSASGRATTGGSSTAWKIVDRTSTNTWAYFDDSLDSDGSIRLRNPSSGSSNYRVVVFYQ